MPRNLDVRGGTRPARRQARRRAETDRRGSERGAHGRGPAPAGGPERGAAAAGALAGVSAVSLLFLDHAKEAYLADLLALEPLLAPGCVVVADNVLSFDGGASLKPYLEHVRDTSRYASSTLHEAPVEYSDGEPDGVEVPKERMMKWTPQLLMLRPWGTPGTRFSKRCTRNSRQMAVGWRSRRDGA